MKITIIKEWQTEAEIDVPDSATELEIRKLADGVANDLLQAEWGGTYATDEDNADLFDWH